MLLKAPVSGAGDECLVGALQLLEKSGKFEEKGAEVETTANYVFFVIAVGSATASQLLLQMTDDANLIAQPVNNGAERCIIEADVD